MRDQIATIKIGTRGTAVDLNGALPESVHDLRVYSNKKRADLDLLTAYPNVTHLFLNGDFSNLDGISGLKGLRTLTMYLSAPVDVSGIQGMELRSLTLGRAIHESVSALLTERVECLELTGLRKLADLSFVEKAAGLKKLYLTSLPAVETLPDFSRIPNLYGLKLYELHKLGDIKSLTRSAIRCLAVALTADRVTGTQMAEVLLGMGRLERADMKSLDRSGLRRYTVLENQLKKAGKAELLTTMTMVDWTRL